MKFYTKENQTTIICHSERRGENFLFKLARFVTKRRYVQNDMNFHSFLTATSH